MSGLCRCPYFQVSILTGFTVFGIVSSACAINMVYMYKHGIKLLFSHTLHALCIYFNMQRQVYINSIELQYSLG